MAGKSISFRSHLIGNASDLISEIGMNCNLTTKLIAGIVSQLAAYSEEGVRLSPTVFICNSMPELIKRAGMGEYIELSNFIPTETAASKVLKATAPLTSNNWQIYIQRSPTGTKCKFGIFSGSYDPSSLTVDEVLLDAYEAGFPIIRVVQSSVNKVEVKTNKGSSIEFRFNDDPDVTNIDHQSKIKLLANAIAAVEDENFDAFSAFVQRFLSLSVSECHGTLLAVTQAGEKSFFPKALKDIVRLDPPLDLHKRFKLHLEAQTMLSVGRLQAATELVKGFVSCDGITVFDTSGKVLGYRGFIMNQKTRSSEDRSGGARTRAFTTLSKMVENKELVAAFFRSQDGRTELKNNEVLK